ncbi:hypothetical protein [Halapricum desulfuricans]|uniref:Uncharacterized protein n=1 Tax=Halapricum desulfuricans TaxID=2841257 RepID=A0A897MXL2_9EURY|nr:hypothetical protein [Halapricum desulfuricans]QSG05187.1 Uncharacterized protein HSR121_0835 [Halapricum desulfuricans]
MPELTRRRALLAATSGIAALAGCTDEDDNLPTDSRKEKRLIEDYDVRHVRDDDGAGLFASGDELPTVSDDERRRYAHTDQAVLVTEDDVSALTFGASPEAARLRTFVRETDFDSSSLYLLGMTVGACYEVRLQSVAVERDELDDGDLHPHADFCRTYRPADVECDADERHTVGVAIRLPVAAEQSTGHGSGMSSSCRPQSRSAVFDATVTPATGGDDE